MTGKVRRDIFCDKSVFICFIGYRLVEEASVGGDAEGRGGEVGGGEAADFAGGGVGGVEARADAFLLAEGVDLA